VRFPMQVASDSVRLGTVHEPPVQGERKSYQEYGTLQREAAPFPNPSLWSPSSQDCYNAPSILLLEVLYTDYEVALGNR
jgi:hypothetical protein